MLRPGGGAVFMRSHLDTLESVPLGYMEGKQLFWLWTVGDYYSLLLEGFFFFRLFGDTEELSCSL